MEEKSSFLCDMLAENTLLMKKRFPTHMSLLHALCAMLYTVRGKKCEVEKIYECIKMIRTKTVVFSSFRSTSVLLQASLLALNDEPMVLLDKSILSYQKLKKLGFHSSAYLASAAIMLNAGVLETEVEAIMKRAQELLRGMKQEHPFLTTNEDYCAIIMLAMREQSTEALLLEIENCIRELRDELHSARAVRSLAFVLSTGQGHWQGKCSRAVSMFRTFKEKGFGFTRDYSLASLGLLALMQDDGNRLIEEAIAINNELKKKKGFGMFMGRRQRIMFAATIKSISYVKNSIDYSPIQSDLYNKEDSMQAITGADVTTVVTGYVSVIATTASIAAAAAAAS